MSLTINYNASAIQAHQALTAADRALSQSLQRLSTGVRLNSSQDDPSALVLANNLRYQLSGLNQASQNSEEGISIIQTADGALDETSSLLNQIRSLAVQAANTAVNNPDQLVAMQSQLDAAIASITRIATDTQFGSQTLLDGSLGGNTLSTAAQPVINGITYNASLTPGGIQPGSNLSVVMPPGGLTLNKAKNSVILSTSGSSPATPPTLNTPIAGLYQGNSAFASPTQLTTVPATLTLNGPLGTQNIAINASTTVSDVLAQINSNGATYGLQAAFDATTGAFTVESTRYGSGTLSVSSTAMNGTVGLFDDDTTSSGNSFTSDGNNNQVQLAYTDQTGTTRTVTLDQQVTADNGLTFSNLGGGPESAPPYTAYGPGAFSVSFKDTSNKVVGAPTVVPFSTAYSAARISSTKIHTGGLSNQDVTIDIPDMRASALGFSANMVSNGLPTLQSLTNGQALINGKAEDALKVIDAAISEVSTRRGALGAVQSNALEPTLSSIQVAVQNLTSSESQLRDTDFAQESANYAKQNILYQAATAMLSQANQVPQTVLQLLKGN
jgi:flagellin